MARWIATLLVAFHHTHNVFINHADIMSAPHAAPVYAWWFLAAFPIAHGALVSFFVISGFLVGGILTEKVRSGKPFLRNYFIDRSVRIYIVMGPALLLTVALDRIGAAIFPGPDLLQVVLSPNGTSLATFLGNVVNLQGIWFSPYGSNGPLWSLGMEFWYYMLAPLLLLPLSPAYSAWTRRAAFVAGLAGLAALTLSGSYFIFGFGLWTLGALARLAPRPVMRSRWLALALYLVVASLLRFVVRLPAADMFPWKYIVDGTTSLLFANLLLTLRFDTEGFGWAKAAFHRKIADFTYSLYAIHLPALIWIAGAAALLFGLEWRRELATPLHYAWTLGAVGVLAAVGYLLSLATEARTPQVRAWARRAFPGGTPAREKEAA